jgi:drug/metabolite transporter (DMT)-like permease
MKIFDWFLFIVLCIIWGSSFILMKEGMLALTPYQVAAIRIFCAGIILLPFSVKALKQLPAKKIPVIILAGLMGSFFPAFLF